MNEILIKRVNETGITIIQDGNDIFVPVRPICNALGVDFFNTEKTYHERPDFGFNCGREDHNCDKVLTLAAIDKALELCPQCDEQVKAEDPIPCAECNGEGTVKWTYKGNNFRLYEMEDECPVCDGRGFSRGALFVKTGRNVPVDGSTVHMGGGLYLGTTMQRLRDAMSLLGVDSVHVVRIHKTELCKCVVDDDIYIIFMPATQRKGTVLASAVVKLQKKGGKLC